MNKSDSLPALPEIYRTAIRVSDVAGRDRQDYRGSFRSPEDQLKQGRRFAEGCGGTHDDAASLQNSDLNVSGFSKKYTERPGLMRHLADAKARLFQHIIFAYTDRSSRGVADGILLYEAFRAAGVQVHYLDNPGSPETDETFETRRDFNLIVSAEVSRRARRRALQNIRSRTADGLPHATPPGWISVDKERKTSDKSRFTINEETVTAYLRIVELRLEMKGGFAIAKTLNEDGVRTQTGKQWTQARVQRILSEYTIRRMLGDAPIATGSYARHADLSKVTWMPNVYPALISTDTADQLRRITEMLRESHPGAKGTRGTSADNGAMLSGKLKCGVCGKNLASAMGQMLVAEDGTRSYRRTYRCVNGGTRDDHPGGGIKVDADGTDDATARALRFALSKPPKFIAKPRPPKKPESTDDIDAELERLKQLHIRGWVTLDEFEEKAIPLKERREAILAAAREADEPSSYAVALAVFEKFPHLDADPSETDAAWRRLVLCAVESVTVPATLPALAECVTEMDAASRRITFSPKENKARRFARIQLRWHVEGHGNVFYAPIYRRTYEATRLLFTEPMVEHLDPD